MSCDGDGDVVVASSPMTARKDRDGRPRLYKGDLEIIAMLRTIEQQRAVVPKDTPGKGEAVDRWQAGPTIVLAGKRQPRSWHEDQPEVETLESHRWYGQAVGIAIREVDYKRRVDRLHKAVRKSGQPMLGPEAPSFTRTLQKFKATVTHAYRDDVIVAGDNLVKMYDPEFRKDMWCLRPTQSSDVVNRHIRFVSDDEEEAPDRSADATGVASTECPDQESDRLVDVPEEVEVAPEVRREDVAVEQGSESDVSFHLVAIPMIDADGNWLMTPERAESDVPEVESGATPVATIQVVADIHAPREPSEERLSDRSSLADDSGAEQDWVPSGSGGESSDGESGDHSGAETERAEESSDGLEQDTVARRGKGSRGGLATAGKPRLRRAPAAEADGARKRRRLECPVEGCTGLVNNLRRHLVQCHGGEMPNWQIDRMVCRKRYTLARDTAVQNKETETSRKWECPTCGKSVVRLDRHLRVHGLDKEGIKALLTRAKNPAARVGSPSRDIPFLQSLLSKFKTWLTSRGGASAPESQATAAVTQVRRILEMMVRMSGGVNLIPGTLQMLNTIGDRGGVLDKIEAKFALSVGTTANYALAAGKFVDFLGHDWSLVKSWSTKEDFLQIAAYVHRVKLNLAKIRRQTAPEDRPRTVGEEDIPGVADVSGYFSSQTSKEVVDVLVTRRPFSTDLYNKVMSHLMLEICFSNAKRAGDLCNLRLDELASARQIEGLHIMRVAKHKVKSKACLVAVTGEVYTWLLRFSTIFRNPRAPRDCPYLFVSKTGRQLKPTDVVTLLNVNWFAYAKETNKKLPRLTTTSIRKATVSLQRRLGATREQEANLAAHMAHDEATAAAYYNLEEGRLRVSQSSKQVRQMWGRDDGRYSSSTSSSGEDEEPSGRASESGGESVDVIPPTPPRPARASSPSSEEVAPPPRPVLKPQKAWTRRFSVREEEALKLVFENYIGERAEDSSLKVLKCDIVQILRDEPRFQEILGHFDPRILTERVRYEVQKKKKHAAKQ